MYLKEAQVGNNYRVVKIDGQGPYKRRIRDMGLTKGSIFFVRKVAPLGDPIQINIRNYELTLRKVDGESIQIEPYKGDIE